MRVFGFALLSGVTFVMACGGGETQSATGETAATVTPAVTPAAPATLSPITGTIHVVNMVGDNSGYRYEPTTITAKPGDGIRFVMKTLGPHNVAFDAADVPADQKAQLWANMGENSMDGLSPMLITESDEWTLSLGNLAAGTYKFFCTPHLAMNMRGEIIVEP